MRKNHIKHIGFVAVIFVIAGLLLSSVVPLQACGGGPELLGFDDPQAPKAIVLAAFGNLSQQLKTKLDPAVTPWTWQEDVFANTSLECPAPGQPVDRILTHGYRVNISILTDGRFISYFFHATKDGQRLFQCTDTGPSALIPVTPVNS